MKPVLSFLHVKLTLSTVPLVFLVGALFRGKGGPATGITITGSAFSTPGQSFLGPETIYKVPK